MLAILVGLLAAASPDAGRRFVEVIEPSPDYVERLLGGRVVGGVKDGGAVREMSDGMDIWDADQLFVLQRLSMLPRCGGASEIRISPDGSVACLWSRPESVRLGMREETNTPKSWLGREYFLVGPVGICVVLVVGASIAAFVRGKL